MTQDREAKLIAAVEALAKQADALESALTDITSWCWGYDNKNELTIKRLNICDTTLSNYRNFKQEAMK